MDQKHIDGAIEAAGALGRRVAVVASSFREMQSLARRFRSSAPEGAISAVRYAGLSTIDFHGGGRIVVFSLSHSGRGYSVDRVLVPKDASPETLAHIVPMTAASEDGQITGY